MELDMCDIYDLLENADNFGLNLNEGDNDVE